MSKLKTAAHVLRGVWRHFSGGWFVWRDASNEAVQWVALQDESSHDAPEAIALIQSARDELKLRYKREAQK